MAYDPTKDVRIYTHGELPGDKNTSILIGVYRYNGTDPKVRVNRSKILRNEELVVGKVGGMSKTEAAAVGRALIEIAGKAEAWG